MTLHLSSPENAKLEGDIMLPGSKSESNRALILQAISKGLIQGARGQFYVPGAAKISAGAPRAVRRYFFFASS